MSLVDADAVRDHLVAQQAPARALALANSAAATASVVVAAYCSRLHPREPMPPVVSTVALAYATRLASNPQAIRSVSAEGQSTDLPPVGFTYLESLLLAPYRRRSA